MSNAATTSPFDTTIERGSGVTIGPWRAPRQMLANQAYGNHASIHDDATAQKLGFSGGTIEGPTHFSQFGPLAFDAWGPSWFQSGCLSVHFKSPCFEGDHVRAFLAEPAAGGSVAEIWMEKKDGTEVLRGSASVEKGAGPTALEVRLGGLKIPKDLVILDGVRIGTRTTREPVRMAFDQRMSGSYPFSLREKLDVITEPSPWFGDLAHTASPFGRPMIPMEMISVLLNYTTKDGQFYSKGPVVGLFADQEIKLLRGPLFVDQPFEIEREIVAISGSRRTESLWILTKLFDPGSDEAVASMLLNTAVLKDSYAQYEAEYARLHRSEGVDRP